MGTYRKAVFAETVLEGSGDGYPGALASKMRKSADEQCWACRTSLDFTLMLRG